MKISFKRILAMMLTICMMFTMAIVAPVSAAEADDGVATAAATNELYVNCDYNSSTEGWGETKFANYAGAYAYATANGKTNATIVIEKTNTLSGNTFDNNHKNYTKLAVVIKDGATMGNAASKWDMTYPVTVEPGGTLTCARPKDASVSYIHIKNTLTVGAEGADKKAVVDFLSDSYQDCDISIRYNGKVIVNNAEFKVQDLDAQGALTIANSDVYVDGAFASATFFATTLTNSTMTVKGNQISGGISDFAGGDYNQLGNVKLNNSTLTIEDGNTKVAANVTATNSDITVNNLTVNTGKTFNLNEGSTLKATGEIPVLAGTAKVKIDGEEASFNGVEFKAPVSVATYEELIAALAAENANVIMTANITATATQSSGYGKAGIVIDAGDVLNGNGKTLTINGAGATWDCAIAMRGGEVKNLTIAGAMRGVFMPGANGDVVIDNCEFKNVIYTFNSDAGSKDYTVTIKNTTLNGWTSFSNAHKSVTFEECTFGEGSGYAFCRPYQATTFVNCAFAEGYKLDTAATADDRLVFNECTYNGEELSVANNAMFYNGGSVVIDGKSTDVTNYPVKIGDKGYATIAEAVANLGEGDTLVISAGEFSEGTIKLPAILKDVTIKGSEGTVLKDMTISAADGNSYSYIGLTFDGITFDNSRLLFTGWRNGEETIEDLTITNCVFKNLNDTTNTAPVHINKDAAKAVNGFTFTNNVIDGATGGSKSGVYLQATGEVTITGNVINNVSFRPYVIQITTDDGIADNFVVTDNTFSGSAVGRAQGLGNNSAGTDAVAISVTGNIFKDITDAQQICYWNFNAEKTTADLSKNYYDIDIVDNPSKIYYNSPATGVEDLVEMGIYPFYNELNTDGTIDTESLVQAPVFVASVNGDKSEK